MHNLKSKMLHCLIVSNLFILIGCFGQQKPNVIFILADDLGYGDLGCYGQKIIQTPHLNKLASEGVRFTQAYAGSTVCAPSRCALMTGYHTGKGIVRNNGEVAGERVNLPDSSVTVAKIFKKQGYATGIFGKWGLGEEGSAGVPNNQGFDEFYGLLDQGQAHRYYVDYAWHNREKVLFSENNQKKDGTNVAEWYVEKLKNFIKANKEKPFFIYFATQLPHAEMVASKKHLQKYLTSNGKSKFNEVPFPGKNLQRASDMPFATYAAMVSQLDEQVGEINTLLKDLGLEENTIILFSSDNGPHKEGGYDPEIFNSNGELRGIKRDLYEGGIRVPLIVKWPGKIPKGTTSNYTFASWDFLPTVTDLLGIQPPGGIDGVSALPALKDKNYKRPAPLYWEFITPTTSFRAAVRDGKWKGVVYGLENQMQLYDLETDPQETKNIAAQFPEKVKELKRFIKQTRVPSKYWEADATLLENFYSKF